MVRRNLARFLEGLVGAFMVISTLSAQQAPPKTVKLPDGTPIHLYLKDDLDSKSSRKGDLIRFQVREDVVVGNVVVIPAGSLAKGHITAVGHRNMAGHSGRLSFSVDYIAAPDGTKVPVVSTPSISGGSNGKVAAAAAATYGPEALLLRGWNADIRKGTMLNAYVDGDHEIEMANLTVHPSYTSSTDHPTPALPTQPPFQHRPNPTAEAHPTVVLIDPSVSNSGDTIDVITSTITIRGAVMDPAGLPAVTINGAPASLLASGPQSAEFNSGQLRLQAGANPFEVVATNAARLQTKIAFVVRYNSKVLEVPRTSSQFGEKALSKPDIISLLQGGVPSARVVDIVNERGIIFVPTEDDIKDIRAAGGGDDLVNALSNAKLRSQRH